MREVAIVSAKRSPIGSFGGSLKNISAVDLGVQLADATIKESKVDPSLVEEIIVGNVLGAGLGQNIARQVALNIGLSYTSTAFTVNMVCGSGMEAIELASLKIKSGEADIILAGGTESMSQAPYLLPNLRWGNKMGDTSTIDLMLKDGLTDAFNDYHMGVTAENIASKYNISRESQDEFALNSQKKAVSAIEMGKFKNEIVPISVPQRRGEPLIFDTDEFPRKDSSIEKLGELKSAFIKDGTVTAGNSSGLNDGAAMVLLVEKEKALELGLNILAVIKSYANAGVDPAIMGTGPIPASKLALKKANLKVEDLDLVESNEAFASQALAVMEELEFEESITNVNGGAIALGHPIGASGARILVSLIHEMKKRDSQYGLATLCIGGGQGAAVVIENA